MATYLALTIGPIYKTMKLARKTREFWVASLLFSLLAKELCEQLKANGVNEKDFLVPHSDIFAWGMINIGLYLDRIICKADMNLWEKLEPIVIDKALACLSESVSRVTPGLSKDVLKSYFKIYAVIKEVDNNKPAINDISDHLDTLELFNIEESVSENDHLIKNFLENVNTDYDDKGEINQSDNFLKEYFDKKDYKNNIRIPSIPEISIKSLYCLTPLQDALSLKDIFEKTLWKKKPDENKMFELLKNSFGKEVKNYNKYICILQADGDKLGRALMKMQADDVVKISKDLIEWGEKDALRLLLDYKALPIYIGGDDVLCFAPVNNGNKNILKFAAELNETYRNKPAIKNIGSTLSIGIKIAYYKSPMYESYLETFALLNEFAKKYNDNQANSCCIALEKHSGQLHQFVFNFDKAVTAEGNEEIIQGEYTQYVEPIYDNMAKDEKKKSFITSVFYKLRANEELIALISIDKERLWFFFENNFDEAKRKDTEEYHFLEKIKEFLFYLFGKYKNKKINNQDLYVAINELYSTLKTIRFIKGLDYDNE